MGILLVAIMILIPIAITVRADANKRYPPTSPAPTLWAIGVFCILIVFLPLYFICRPKTIVQQNTKKCPQCAESIRIEALKCRFCGFEFDKESVAQHIIDTYAISSIEEHTRKSAMRNTWGNVLIIAGAIIGLFLLITILTTAFTDDPRLSENRAAGIIGSLFLLVLFSLIPILSGVRLKRKAKHGAMIATNED